MVVIRMQRVGTKNVSRHRIVVMDRRKAQNGRVLEILGHYDAVSKPPRFEINESRMVFWISSGAQTSEALSRLVKKFKRISVASAKD